jgi:hypothetical protein
VYTRDLIFIKSFDICATLWFYMLLLLMIFFTIQWQCSKRLTVRLYTVYYNDSAFFPHLYIGNDSSLPLSAAPSSVWWWWERWEVPRRSWLGWPVCPARRTPRTRSLSARTGCTPGSCRNPPAFNSSRASRHGNAPGKHVKKTRCLYVYKKCDEL